MPVNFKLRTIARERELTLLKAHHGGSVVSHNLRFRILYSFYNAYVFNVYGRFVLYLHLHYQVIPKITCVFSKPEYESMPTVEQI